MVGGAARVSALDLAREYLMYGRFAAADAVARSLLAADCARDAAALLLELRIEQGWFADAAQLARERILCRVSVYV